MADPCIQEETIGTHNAEIASFKTYMEDQKVFQRSVGISLIGIVFTIFVQIVCFAVLWGQVTTQVKFNTGALDQICTLSLRQQRQLDTLR
jgi:hypothetical protein